MANTSVDGLVSGLKTSDIIEQLMSAERAPVDRLTARKAKYDDIAAAWTDIGSRVAALRSTVDALALRSRFNDFSTTSSNESILTATASSSASTGSLSFTVLTLAAAHQLTSAGFASASATVGAGVGTIAGGLSTIGASAVTADGTIASGKHTVRVTAVSGTSATFDVDGVTTAVNNWTPGGTVSVNGTGGALTLTVGAGLTVGTADVTVVRTTTSTTLAELASTISAAGGGASAQVIDIGNGATPAQLVVSATKTGTAHALTVDLSGLSGFAGGLTSLRDAADATIKIGAGVNAITATRSTNTITDLVQGVSLHLTKADPTEEVTVTVDRDTAALETKVKNLVNALNGVVDSVAARSTFDPKSGTKGLLFGDMAAQRVVEQLYTQTGLAATSGTLRTLSQLGITLTAKGKYQLDESKLTDALAEHYDDVVNLLARNGEATDARLSYVSATNATAGGAHAVVVTQAATQASATGAAFGTLASDETITVKVGNLTASFTAGAGSDAAAVASGLNAQLSAARLGVQATVVSGAVVLASSGFGSATSFSVKSSVASGPGQTGFGGATPDTYAAHAGTNAAGTIDGIAATGAGQALTAASGTAAGLAVKVTATADEIAAAGGSLALGSLSYNPGVIGALSRTVALDEGANGSIETAKDGANKESTALQTHIDDFTVRLQQVELRYRLQFSRLETTLGQLRDQSSWLASQIANLP